LGNAPAVCNRQPFTNYKLLGRWPEKHKLKVNGSDSTAGLKRNLEKDDNKIVVTTIQKLNNLMKGEADLPIYRSGNR